MKYEIKSKATGKVIYEAESDDPANDWNVTKRLVLLDRSDEKLRKNLEKHGVQDFEFSIVEPPKPEKVKKPKEVETEIIEPEIEPEVVKKRTHKRK
jgi:hypothetical protein